MSVAKRERLSSRVVPGRRPGPQAGFTLLEVMMAATVMVVGLMGFLQVMVLAIGSSSANREADLATDAARQQIEVIQATNFRDIFRMFNDAPGDDPGAIGSAPGADFAVPGLDPDPADPDGMVGRIDLPSVDVGNGVQHLREDFQDSDLGMPRDLTGDGVWNDMLDHSGDYQLLPVVVRLRWRGATGISRMEFRTVIAEM
jgi:prepilin-type N-terminal cleavage/methylation domain-containing protein